MNALETGPTGAIVDSCGSWITVPPAISQICLGQGIDRGISDTAAFDKTDSLELG